MNQNRPLLLASLLVALNLIGSGLLGCLQRKQIMQPEFKGHVAFHQGPLARRPIRRIVVLPIEDRGQVKAETLSLFQGYLSAKIREAGNYEVVDIPEYARPPCPQQWILQGRYPETLLVDLFHKYSADGVLFVSINEFQPYDPVTIAVTVHLVDTDQGIVLSSVDGNWSADHPALITAFKNQPQCHDHPEGAEAMLNSPRAMMTFVARQIATELGKRKVQTEASEVVGGDETARLKDQPRSSWKR